MTTKEYQKMIFTGYYRSEWLINPLLFSDLEYRKEGGQFIMRQTI